MLLCRAGSDGKGLCDRLGEQDAVPLRLSPEAASKGGGTVNTAKLLEWGTSLESAPDQADLTRRAKELAQTMKDADAMRETARNEPDEATRAELIARADDLLTRPEYGVLCEIGRKRREELTNETR